MGLFDPHHDSFHKTASDWLAAQMVSMCLALGSKGPCHWAAHHEQVLSDPWSLTVKAATTAHFPGEEAGQEWPQGLLHLSPPSQPMSSEETFNKLQLARVHCSSPQFGSLPDTVEKVKPLSWGQR